MKKIYAKEAAEKIGTHPETLKMAARGQLDGKLYGVQVAGVAEKDETGVIPAWFFSRALIAELKKARKDREGDNRLKQAD